MSDERTGCPPWERSHLRRRATGVHTATVGLSPRHTCPRHTCPRHTCPRKRAEADTPRWPPRWINDLLSPGSVISYRARSCAAPTVAVRRYGRALAAYRATSPVPAPVSGLFQLHNPRSKLATCRLPCSANPGSRAALQDRDTRDTNKPNRLFNKRIFLSSVRRTPGRA